MKIKKIPDNDLSDQIYKKGSLPIVKLSILAFGLFCIGFALNFPFREIIIQQISKQISSQKACPIYYKELGLSFFLTSATLKDININGRCFGKPRHSLLLDDALIGLSARSFFPPGLKFHVQINKGISQVNLYPTISFNKQLVRITDSKINLEDLKSLTGGGIYFQGNLEIDSLITIIKEEINSVSLLVQSKDFVIPPQKINGFDVPHLPLKNLSLKGRYKGKNLTLTDDGLIVGDKSSPIHAKITGKILLNTFNIKLSKLDLIADVKFAKSFLDEFAILNLLLGDSKTKEGFYQIKITGNLAKPNAVPLQ